MKIEDNNYFIGWKSWLTFVLSLCCNCNYQMHPDEAQQMIRITDRKELSFALEQINLKLHRTYLHSRLNHLSVISSSLCRFLSRYFCTTDRSEEVGFLYTTNAEVYASLPDCISTLQWRYCWEKSGLCEHEQEIKNKERRRRKVSLARQKIYGKITKIKLTKFFPSTYIFVWVCVFVNPYYIL